MTSTQNKIEALQRAKRHLKGEGFVCLALDRVRAKHLRTAVADLNAYISEVLEGHWTLEAWLAENHGVCEGESYKNVKMYHTRVAWVDWMIAQLEAACPSSKAGAASTCPPTAPKSATSPPTTAAP